MKHRREWGVSTVIIHFARNQETWNRSKDGPWRRQRYWWPVSTVWGCLADSHKQTQGTNTVQSSPRSGAQRNIALSNPGRPPIAKTFPSDLYLAFIWQKVQVYAFKPLIVMHS